MPYNPNVDEAWKSTWAESVKGILIDGVNHPIDASMLGNTTKTQTVLYGTYDFANASNYADGDGDSYYGNTFNTVSAWSGSTADSGYLTYARPSVSLMEYLIVTWDGKRYGCRFDAEDDMNWRLGSLDKYPFEFHFNGTYEDNAYPYAKLADSVDVYCTEASTHTFSIESTGKSAFFDSLNGACIQRILYSYNVQGTSTGSFSTYPFDISGSNQYVRSLQKGDRLVIVMDGETYLVAVSDNSGTAELGDSSFTYYPFYIQFSGENSFDIAVSGDSEQGHYFDMYLIVTPIDMMCTYKMFKAYDGSDYNTYTLLELLQTLINTIPWDGGNVLQDLNFTGHQAH